MTHREDSIDSVPVQRRQEHVARLTRLHQRAVESGDKVTAKWTFEAIQRNSKILKKSRQKEKRSHAKAACRL